MNLPSKELLSEVLGYEVYDISNYYEQRMADYKEDFISFKSSLNGCRRNPINIHELSHKCKEWALTKGLYFSMYSFNFSSNTEQEHRVRLLKGNKVVYSGNDSCKETEPEAIFKACQWVLDNKETK